MSDTPIDTLLAVLQRNHSDLAVTHRPGELVRVGELGVLDIQTTTQSGNKGTYVLARRYDEDNNEVFVVSGSEKDAVGDAVAQAVEYLQQRAVP